MINDTSIIEGHPVQVTGFTALFHVSTPLMTFFPPTLLLATWKHHHMPGEQCIREILLPSIMIEQIIIKAVLCSIEMFNGTKSKFKA